MSRIAVIGASSQLGQELVTAAVRKEHTVNAVVADATQVTRQQEEITTIEADPFTGRGLGAAVSGCHFVIWALTSRRSIVAEGLKNLLEELKSRRALKRLVFVSRLGIGTGPETSGLLAKLRALPGLPGASAADLRKAEAHLRASSLPFVIFRPSSASGEPKDRRILAVGPRDAVPGPLSRPEFARFIVATLEQTGWDRGEFVVGSTDQADPFLAFNTELDSESVIVDRRLAPEETPGDDTE